MEQEQAFPLLSRMIYSHQHTVPVQTAVGVCKQEGGLKHWLTFKSLTSHWFTVRVRVKSLRPGFRELLPTNLNLVWLDVMKFLIVNLPNIFRIRVKVMQKRKPRTFSIQFHNQKISFCHHLFVSKVISYAKQRQNCFFPFFILSSKCFIRALHTNNL